MTRKKSSRTELNTEAGKLTTGEDLHAALASSSENLTAGGSPPDMTDQLVAALTARREADRALSEFLASLRSSGALTKEQRGSWKVLLRSVRDADRNVKAFLAYSETFFRYERR